MAYAGAGGSRRGSRGGQCKAMVSESRPSTLTATQGRSQRLARTRADLVK
uniref:Uncharacterized protein n=1 Tax=Arundo donax TaxID=35708 RepID=A0A0A9E170_ARUDO